MKKLSKTELEARAALVAKLKDKFEQLVDGCDQFNSAVNDAWGLYVENAQVEYNDALKEAEDWRDQIVSQIDEYVDGRSDKWREGDQGQKYEDWKSELEGISFTESEMEEPSGVEVDVENVADELDGLPDGVE